MTTALTMFLLKKTVQSIDDAVKLKNDKSLLRLELKKGFSEGAFFTRQVEAKAPRWVSEVRVAVKNAKALDDLRNMSQSGLLVVKASERLFAVTFGHGRYLLAPDAFEEDFGLRVALNSVDPVRLRSVDISRVEELSIHTRRQTSRSAPLGTFGLDVSRDLLRAVTGQPRDPRFATTVTGADALRISTNVKLTNLDDLCRQLLVFYEDTGYRTHFPWIDSLRVVKNEQTIAELDQEMVKSLMASPLDDKLYLAPSEPLPWERVEGFRYDSESEDEQLHDDMDAQDYIDTLKGKNITLDRLKRSHVRVLGTGGDVVAQMPIYKTVVFEVSFKGSLYVLSSGRWYKVAPSFVRSVDDWLQTIDTSHPSLPPAKTGENEGVYNARVAALLNYALLDGKVVKPRGAQDPIEFCDLLTPARELIHVKRRTRSSTLSHLFAQGWVSAQAFLGDEDFRKAVREKVAPSDQLVTKVVPLTRPHPEKYTVVYAIVSNKKNDWPLSLPFFSRLHLMQTATQLLTIGFKVSVIRVDEGGPSPGAPRFPLPGRAVAVHR